MKVIDKSSQTDEGSANRWVEKIRNFWQYGLGWSRDLEAQEDFIAHASRLLDNKYTLLQNVSLPGLDVPIPLILVGPTGLWVIYASAIKGIFRVKNETWAQMDNRSQHFRPANPNLMARTILVTRAVETYLTNSGEQIPSIEPVLYLSNPGIHVDSVRPSVRIFLVDAIDRFIASILQAQANLNAEVIERIVNAMAAFEAKPVEPEATLTIQTPEGVRTAATYLSSSKRLGIVGMYLPLWQWIILGVLIIMEIFILVSFAILVFFTS
jgi:hypothetical protein